MERVDYEKLVIQDLINSWKSKEIDVSPWYQRRSVWDKLQKAYLINSIFEHKPIPSIYIRHYIDIDKEKSIKEIVDGQQRIRAILEYVNGEFAVRHPNHKKPALYSDLTRKELESFLMTSLSIGLLVGSDDSDVIDIFGRLNSVSKSLNAPEKRNARYSGEFKQFCLSQAAAYVKLYRDYRIFTANEIARMIEVEFTAELIINMIKGLSDHSPTLINQFYSQYNESFPKAEEMKQRMDRVFLRIAEMEPGSIRDTIFSRQPLFFSLFIILDSINVKIERSNLEDGLHKMDVKFNTDVPISNRSKLDAEFYVASTSTTQRIKQRKIRDAYIRRELKLKG